jgi:ubiquitin-protein ligase
MAVGYSPRNPVYKPISTREDGSVASDLSSLSDLSSRGFDKINISKETAPIKRLYKEYVDIRKNPLPNISIAPLPKNFFEWHGNIRAPDDTLYKKGIFHFSIEFRDDHPNTAPFVNMKTRIKHPCVRNCSIELDTLRNPKERSVLPEKRYYYYSPRYTVRSILIQLQAFFYEGTVEIALENLTDLGTYSRKKEEYISGVQFSVEQSLRYSCEQCRHRSKNFWPPLPGPDDILPPPTKEESTYSDFLVCYQTLKTHEEAPLGLGISFTKNVRTGRLQQVTCASDILSLNAYKGQNVREMWQHKFTHWIPVYLAHSNPDRALYLAKRTLSSIYNGSPTEFQSTMALDFFPKLLTHLTLRYVHTYIRMYTCVYAQIRT